MTYESSTVHNSLDNPRNQRTTTQFTHLLRHFNPSRQNHIIIPNHILILRLGRFLQRIRRATKEVFVEW